GITEVVLAEPVPAVAAAEGGEAQVTALHGIEHVLLSAADAGRRGVRLLESPLGGARVEGPGFGVLLAAATLVVAAEADDHFVYRVAGQRRLVGQAGRRWGVLERAALDPGVRLLHEGAGFGGDQQAANQ